MLDPEENWLKQLVAPLADETLGAASGYRWFLPVNGGIASRLRGVWNASVASAFGSDTTKNFCWGGSTAIRRTTFERLDVGERWRGTVSDDFAITRILKEANLPIHFTPNCLVPSVGDCDFKELFEFTTRQIKITRVYASQLWLPLLLGSALFTIVFFGGLILLILQILANPVFLSAFADYAVRPCSRSARQKPSFAGALSVFPSPSIAPQCAGISWPTSSSGPSLRCSTSTTPSSPASRAESNGAA